MTKFSEWECKNIFTTFWAGAGTTNAPDAANYKIGTLGANNDGASSADVYHVVDVFLCHGTIKSRSIKKSFES